MLSELIIALAIGIGLGTITGLVPGIHINLVSLVLLNISPILLNHVSVITLGVFIISMAVTHILLDNIPSVFLGAPDSGNALLILPGHKLLLEGRGFEAVKLTVIGNLFCLILSILLIPLFIPIIKILYDALKDYIGYILILFMVFMIFKEKHRWKWNLAVFMISGVLGLCVFNLNLKDPLFPMLSGLFGTSMLCVSLLDKVNIPEQTAEDTINIGRKKTLKAFFAGTFAGSLTSFFPGLGPSEGAVIASQMTGDIGDYGYIILVGGINIVNFMLSLVSLFVLEKARNGAVLVVAELMKINVYGLLIFVSAALIAGGVSAFLALKITKLFAKLIVKANYFAMVMSVIIFITILVFYFSGWKGLIVLAVSTFVGIIPSEVGVARNHQMGCLILPVILYFVV